MTQTELDEILKKHKMWLNGKDGGERAGLSNSDLSGSNLSNSDLRYSSLSYSDLSYSNLRYSNLRYSNLSCSSLSNSDLRYSNLSNSDLSGSDLSGAKGLLSTIDYLAENFEKTDEGYIVYKTFGLYKNPPHTWDIKSGAIIEENVNSYRTDDCGCGVNVSTLDWIKKKNKKNLPVWKLLIRWEWAAGIVVPYNTDGKIRCERAMLLEEVDIQ